MSACVFVFVVCSGRRERWRGGCGRGGWGGGQADREDAAGGRGKRNIISIGREMGVGVRGREGDEAGTVPVSILFSQQKRRAGVVFCGGGVVVGEGGACGRVLAVGEGIRTVTQTPEASEAFPSTQACGGCACYAAEHEVFWHRAL